MTVAREFSTLFAGSVLATPGGVQTGAGPDSAREGESDPVEHDVMEERARPVSTRFELAVGRMIDKWLAAGRVQISASDVALAREFLEHSGCKVEDVPGARLRVVSRRGRSQEMPREGAVMVALRRLAEREQ